MLKHVPVLILFWALCPGILPAVDNTPTRFDYEDEKMGVPIRISFYAETREQADNAANAVLARFDDLNAKMSDYDPESEIIQVCRKSAKSGGVIPVSDDLRTVFEASRHFTELTDGAFDITVSPIVKLWRRSRSFHELPPKKYLDAAKELVGNDRWELTDDGIRVFRDGVRFDLGGIAKGFALDESLRILNEQGIDAALIDAGGDIRLGNPPPGESGWKIGIASLAENAESAFYLRLSNVGIATSGDTFRYVEIDNVRYSHLIDPRTGEPLTRHAVVSVIAPDAITADAFASACCVLTPEQALKLAESRPGVDVLIFQLQEPSPNDSADKISQPGKSGERTKTFATGLFKEYVATP